jgi:hypothetical protein
MCYGATAKLDNGGNHPIQLLNKAPLILQTPQMWAPLESKSEMTKVSQFTLDLSFKGMDYKGPAFEVSITG